MLKNKDRTIKDRERGRRDWWSNRDTKVVIFYSHFGIAISSWNYLLIILPFPLACCTSVLFLEKKCVCHQHSVKKINIDLRLLFTLPFGLRFCGLIVNVFRARAFIPLKTCYGYLFVNCYSLGEISKFSTFRLKIEA